MIQQFQVPHTDKRISVKTSSSSSLEQITHTMTLSRQSFLSIVVLGLSFLNASIAFAPVNSAVSRNAMSAPASFNSQRSAFLPSSSMEVAAETLDPTAFLSDVLGGLIGGPAILAVPILAALGVASLVAFFIVSYANPEVEDDE